MVYFKTPQIALYFSLSLFMFIMIKIYHYSVLIPLYVGTQMYNEIMRLDFLLNTNRCVLVATLLMESDFFPQSFTMVPMGTRTSLFLY